MNMKFEVDAIIDELNELVFGDSTEEKCSVCFRFYPGDEIWECPSNGNKRCDKCQLDHEINECPPCRLTYQDV